MDGLTNSSLGAPAGMLDGIVVLDCGGFGSAQASMFLMQLGARVIKIDGAQEPTDGRACDPSALYYDAGKELLRLGFPNPCARDLLFRLARCADVVVEGFAEPSLDDRGCGYADVAKANLRIVWAAITPFGTAGPRKDWLADDETLAAWGGSMFVTGEPGRQPLRPGGAQASHIAGLNAASAVAAALYSREITGRGRFIDVSAQEAVAGALDYVLPDYLYEGKTASRHGAISHHGRSFLLPCEDGQLLAHVNPGQWETLVEWMDGEGMAGELIQEEWRDEKYRLEHADRMVDIIGAWSRRHSADDLCEVAQLMRLAWTKVVSPGEVADDPQLSARHALRTIEVPGGGTVLAPTPPSSWRASRMGAPMHWRRATKLPRTRSFQNCLASAIRSST